MEDAEEPTALETPTVSHLSNGVVFTTLLVLFREH